MSRLRMVIRKREFRSKMLALFDELERSERKMQAFVRNPTKVLATVFDEEFSPFRQSESNRLLFSMLANDKFRRWLDRYANAKRKQTVTDNVFAQEFAKAVIKYGDDNILLAVLRNQGESIRLPGMGHQFKQLVINNPAKQTAATDVCTPSSCDTKNTYPVMGSTAGFQANETGR